MNDKTRKAIEALLKGQSYSRRGGVWRGPTCGYTPLIIKDDGIYCRVGGEKSDADLLLLAQTIAGGAHVNVIPDWVFDQPIPCGLSSEGRKKVPGELHPLAVADPKSAVAWSLTSVRPMSAPIYALWIPDGGADGRGSWLVDVEADIENDHPAVFYEREFADSACKRECLGGTGCVVVELRAVAP